MQVSAQHVKVEVPELIMPDALTLGITIGSTQGEFVVPGSISKKSNATYQGAIKRGLVLTGGTPREILESGVVTFGEKVINRGKVKVSNPRLKKDSTTEFVEGTGGDLVVYHSSVVDLSATLNGEETVKRYLLNVRFVAHSARVDSQPVIDPATGDPELDPNKQFGVKFSAILHGGGAPGAQVIGEASGFTIV